MVPQAYERRCFEDARSNDPYDENNVKLDLSFYAPLFTQFGHWLKINIQAKRKKTIRDEEPHCNTIIRYAPLDENVPLQGTGSHKICSLIVQTK